MNKVICNALAYVLRSEIEETSDRTIRLKEGVTWKIIPVISKPVYQSEISQSGLTNHLNKETVSAQIIYDSGNAIIVNPGAPIILRLQSDKDIFYVGTWNLPVRMTYTTNKITASLAFKTASPV